MHTGTRHLLRSVLLLMVIAQPASAQFQPCPASDGGFVCQISTANSTLTVFAGNGLSPVLQVDSWLVNGVEQMGIETYRVRNDDAGAFVPFGLFSAEIATDTGQILIVHEDSEDEELALSSIFTLREMDETTWFDVDLSLNLLTGSATGRLFMVTDLNLGGSTNDDSVEADATGLPLVQSGDGYEATVTLEQGSAPTAFDVGLASEFAPLLSNTLVTLDGTQSASGPADLGSAIAWQATLSPGEPLQFRVRRTVPEPSPTLTAAAAMLTLAALAGRRPSSQSWG